MKILEKVLILDCQEKTERKNKMDEKKLIIS